MFGWFTQLKSCNGWIQAPQEGQAARLRKGTWTLFERGAGCMELCLGKVLELVENLWVMICG